MFSLNGLKSRYGAWAAIRNALIAVILSISPGFAENSVKGPEIVILGDSLTAGYGLEPEQGLVPQLQAWLSAKGTAAALVNAGVSGDTTAGGLARLDWSLTPQTKGLVVILGGNDLLRGLPPAEARANLTAIMEGAKARGLPVLLVPMKAPGNYGAQYADEFDAIYPDLATGYGSLLAPELFSPLRAINPDPAALAAFMQADGIHPAPGGVAEIVKGLGPHVVELAGKILAP